MYRLTNLTLNTTTTYKNKDLVYQALERENAKVKHQEAEGVLLVEELDKKGVVIYQEDIYLPFDGIADSLFLKAGTDNLPKSPPKTRGFSFLKPSERKLDQEPNQIETEEPVSAPTPQAERRQSKFFFLKVLWQGLLLVGMMTSLAVASWTMFLVTKQEKVMTDLSHQVKALETLQSEAGKLDTFVRYFLPRYYSDQGQLEDFVEGSLKLNNQTGQLQSVILENNSQTGKNTYQLTYVLSIKEGDNRSQKRLTVTVKEASSSPYGYQVIAEPTLANYPN
ncbi:hypothetical protein KB565_07400 [Streptococcus canis]|uniref:hypothetical protein n=1 Tax=Streptococcus canis TaxID=1329 RepID=UPI00294A58A5|nr:hypothetical protein [Streptococcus canis]MDV6001632.1 hypothetical protein [Streptococcus canis]